MLSTIFGVNGTLRFYRGASLAMASEICLAGFSISPCGCNQPPLFQ